MCMKLEERNVVTLRCHVDENCRIFVQIVVANALTLGVHVQETLLLSPTITTLMHSERMD